ncbi:MAG: hypothetical protein WAU11_11010 [Ignavibacteriaceae bacterium]
MTKTIKRNISEIIFEGPEFIQNIPYSASYDSIIRINKLPYHPSQVNKSFGIFVDNTINKHRNFLNPIIRISEYSKNTNLPIVIYLKIPKKYFSQMSELISQIDISLTRIKFVKAGLILNRIPPNNCIDIWEDFKNNFSLEIYRWNYCQKINYKFGVQKGNPDKFAKSLIEFINFCEIYKNKFSSVIIEENYSVEKSEYLREHKRNKG